MTDYRLCARCLEDFAKCNSKKLRKYDSITIVDERECEKNGWPIINGVRVNVTPKAEDLPTLDEMKRAVESGRHLVQR